MQYTQKERGRREKKEGDEGMKSQVRTFSSVCILPPSLLRWLTSIYRDIPKIPPNHTEKRIKERVLQKRRQKEEVKREVIGREK